jgi:hypothetical protein
MVADIVRRALLAFANFWREFLIGDAPEFAVITCVVIGLAYALRSHRDVGIVLLPVVTLVAVGVSASRARRP